MATTNKEIIATAKAMNGVDAEKLVNTYAEWKRNGFCVRRGEKALFKTKIWKPCKPSKKSAEKLEKEGKPTDKKRLYLVNASFFSEDQVERFSKERKN